MRFLPEVLRTFGLEFESHDLIRQRRRKTVWRVFTNRGPVAVTEFLTQGWQPFTLGVQHHVQQRAGIAPAVCQSREGRFLVPFAGRYYSATEWVGGTPVDPHNDNEILHRMMPALARLHLAARDVRYPAGTAVPVRADRWLAILSATLDQMRADARRPWRKDVRAAIARYTPKLHQRGTELLDRLAQTGPYQRAARQAVEEGRVAHGDTNHTNLLISNGQPYWIDFESAAVDLQIRDLSSRLERLCRRYWNGWDEEKVTKAVAAYDRVSPLTKEERWLLWVDLSFPHRYARLLHKRKPEKVTPADVESIGRLSVEIGDALRSRVVGLK